MSRDVGLWLRAQDDEPEIGLLRLILETKHALFSFAKLFYKSNANTMYIVISLAQLSSKYIIK